MSEIYINVCKDALAEMFGIAEEIKAIEVLEYHNKNHLALDDPRRSRNKIALLDKILETIGSYL